MKTALLLLALSQLGCATLTSVDWRNPPLPEPVEDTWIVFKYTAWGQGSRYDLPWNRDER